MNSKLSKSAAFSFVEVIIVLAVLGIVAAVAVPFLSDVTTGTQEQKLANDADALNRAVDTYLASGGSLDDAETPDDVIVKLRTQAAADQAMRLPGLSSSMVDPRIGIVMQTAGEAGSGKPRVQWDVAEGRFVVAHSGAAGVKEFIIDDALAEVDGGTETRDPTMMYAKDDTWVWDFQDRNPEAYLGPSVVSVSADPTDPPVLPSDPPTGGPPVIPPPPGTLASPTFSLPGGSFAVANFPLPLTLFNINPPGSSKIIYAVNFGEFQDYSGTLAVPADATISAQAVALKSSWSDSGKVDQVYEATTPGSLLPPVINLSHSKFTSSVQTITVTLGNPNPVDSSSLEYAITEPAGTFPPLTAYQSYNTPISVSASSYPDGFRISTYAKTLDSASYLDSPTVEGQTTSEFFGVGLATKVLLVLDASGSMDYRWSRTTRFRRVIEEAVDTINTMSLNQEFAVATFNHGLLWTYGGGDLQDATPENRQAAITGLQSMNSNGGTNYEAGLDYALSLATVPEQVIFLSDGLPNYQNYNDEVDQLTALGVAIHTVGIGSNSSQSTLQALATRGNGTYNFVNEPGTGGTLDAPDFSQNGGDINGEDLPVQIVLSNPNADPNSRVFYAIDGSAYQVYSSPINITNKMTIDAFCESTDEIWSPSPLVTEVYNIKPFKADRPSIVVSSGSFKDDHLTMTITLENNDDSGLSTLVWWFENQTQEFATAYTGPFQLSASDWNSFAGESVKDIKIFARAVSDIDYVENSDIEDQTIKNETTAFEDNLSNNDPLDEPQFNPGGNKFDYTEYPLTIELINPENLGSIKYSIDGSPFVTYTGPFTIGGEAQIGAYVDSPGIPTRRDSEPVYEQYVVDTFNLDKPELTYSSLEFLDGTSTITVSATNPNPSAISQIIYWWDGVQDEDTEFTVYTGPITLSAADWEQFAKDGKTEGKLKFRSVGTESFVSESGHVELKIKKEF